MIFLAFADTAEGPVAVPGPTQTKRNAIGKIKGQLQEERVSKLLGDRYEDHGLIFCQRNGKPLHAHNVAQRDLRRVLALKSLRTESREKGAPEESLPKPLPHVRYRLG